MAGTIEVFSTELMQRAADIIERCCVMGHRMVTAESCTGGLVAALLTAIPGSSGTYQYGYVTYSNESKQNMIGVPEELLEKHGAVSPEVARAMAEGALINSNASHSIAITGIAGPGGGSDEKPVGLVYIAIGQLGKDPDCKRYVFEGERETVRMQAVKAALDQLAAAI